MKCAKEIMLLYAVTDRTWLGEQTLYQQVESALQGGVTCLQLREKDLPEQEFLAEALEIGALCRKYQVPFIINDNVNVAIGCQADGVHIGQGDIQVEEARRLIGPDMLLGVSAQTVEQARSAVAAGADYLGVGAVFPTATKDDAKAVSGDTLAAICGAVDVPVVAIGGINKENILQLQGTNVDGAALVSAIFSAEDITAECVSLRKLAERMVYGDD